MGAAAFMFSRPGDGPAFEPWSRLGTDDVHVLAFVDDDPDRLLFGHHGGVMSSGDGGRTWERLATGSDAMALRPASDGSIVIAGHEILTESRDDGRTWRDIPADLPSLDIHGFARDPADPARMWAYLAIGGLWESADGGRTWVRVQQANVVLPVAFAGPVGTTLVGVLANGLARSTDGGRSWQSITSPELYPLLSLAAPAAGSVLVAGGPDGLVRSDDAGGTWSRLPSPGPPLALAVALAGRTIALVTPSTEFFRSDDGGLSWSGP